MELVRTRKFSNREKTIKQVVVSCGGSIREVLFRVGSWCGARVVFFIEFRPAYGSPVDLGCWTHGGPVGSGSATSGLPPPHWKTLGLY